MNMNERFSHFLSPKSNETYRNRSFTTRSPKRSQRMQSSPSLTDFETKYFENESVIRSPIVADLQIEYVKALNVIDSLKAENKEIKNAHKIDDQREILNRRDEFRIKEESYSNDLSLIYKKEACQAARDLEQIIEELERDKQSLLKELEAERNRIQTMKKEQETNHEKLNKFDEISASNVHLREEMSRLNIQLSEIGKAVVKLEAENLKITQSANNREVQDFIRHLDYILSVLEDLPDNHSARIFFDERFKSGPEVTSYLHQKKYSALLVKSIQFAADLLVHMTRDNSKFRNVVTQKYKSPSKAQNDHGIFPNQKASGSSLNVKKLLSSNITSEDFGNPISNQEQLDEEFAITEEKNLNTTEESENSGSLAELSNFSTLKETPRNNLRTPKDFDKVSNAGDNLKNLVRQKINSDDSFSQKQSKVFVVKGKSKQASVSNGSQLQQPKRELEKDANNNLENARRVQYNTALSQKSQNVDANTKSMIQQSNPQRRQAGLKSSASFKQNMQYEPDSSNLENISENEGYLNHQNHKLFLNREQNTEGNTQPTNQKELIMQYNKGYIVDEQPESYLAQVLPEASKNFVQEQVPVQQKIQPEQNYDKEQRDMQNPRAQIQHSRNYRQVLQNDGQYYVSQNAPVNVPHINMNRNPNQQNYQVPLYDNNPYFEGFGYSPSLYASEIQIPPQHLIQIPMPYQNPSKNPQNYFISPQYLRSQYHGNHPFYFNHNSPEIQPYGHGYSQSEPFITNNQQFGYAAHPNRTDFYHSSDFQEEDSGTYYMSPRGQTNMQNQMPQPSNFQNEPDIQRTSTSQFNQKPNVVASDSGRKTKSDGQQRHQQMQNNQKIQNTSGNPDFNPFINEQVRPFSDKFSRNVSDTQQPQRHQPQNESNRTLGGNIEQNSATAFSSPDKQSETVYGSQKIDKNNTFPNGSRSSPEKHIRNKSGGLTREMNSSLQTQEIEGEPSGHFLSTNSTPLRNNRNVPIPIEKQPNPNDYIYIPENDLSTKGQRSNLETFQPDGKVNKVDKGINTGNSFPKSKKREEQDDQNQELQDQLAKQTRDTNQSLSPSLLSKKDHSSIQKNQSTNTDITQRPSTSQSQSIELSTDDRRRPKSPHISHKLVSFDEDSNAQRDRKSTSIQESQQTSKWNAGNHASSPVRMPRFTASTPKNNSSIERTSPMNASVDAGTSQRNLNFRVSFGKTFRLDSGPMDRFDMIPSDIVSIDEEYLKKRHVTPKQRSFNIISGLPKDLNIGIADSPSSRMKRSNTLLESQTNKKTENTQPQLKATNYVVSS